jgi:hypothetical protein
MVKIKKGSNDGVCVNGLPAVKQCQMMYHAERNAHKHCTAQNGYQNQKSCLILSEISDKYVQRIEGKSWARPHNFSRITWKCSNYQKQNVPQNF